MPLVVVSRNKAEKARRPASGCGRCGALPVNEDGPGHLFLWPPVAHTLAKLSTQLTAFGREHEVDGAQGRLAVEVAAGQLGRLCADLAGGIGEQEARDTNVLFVPEGRAPAFDDFARVLSLDVARNRARYEWLKGLIGGRNLTCHFQPIVAAAGAGAGAPFAHEILVRGRGDGGVLISPGMMFEVARKCDLLFQLDRAARETAVRRAAAADSTGRYFINFAPSALYDPESCLRSTLALVDASGMKRDRLVFEAIETERVASADHVAKILDYLRAEGFQVALDNVGAGYSTLNPMGAVKPDYVKIDRSLITGVESDAYKGAIVRRLIDLAHEVGARVIAQGVEKRPGADWLAEAGADLLQGWLFGKPADAPRARPAGG